MGEAIEAVFGEGGRSIVASAVVARFGQDAEPMVVTLDENSWERPLRAH